MNNDLCSILGVSSGASMDEIHAAFRKKAREHHPDLGGDRKKFQQINVAYEQLIKHKEAEKSASTVQAPQSPAASPNPYQTPAKPKRKKKPSKKKPDSSSDDFRQSARQILTGKLPLQNQTTFFILVNALDIFVTYLHLQSGNYEANPIAAFFISKWNVLGMVAYKMTIVATVCVIAQIVALKSLQKANWLLNFGTGFILCVVIYSIWLLTR